MPVMPPLRHIIVCDEVRREDNGKEIIIGVYSGGIRFRRENAPGKLRLLSIRFEFSPDPSEFSGPLNFQMVAPSGAPVINASPTVDLNSEKRTVLILTHENLVLYEPGMYKLKVGLSEEPIEVDTVDVVFAAAEKT